MIDTHCHISSEYYSDINKLIENNKESGVSKIIISGCTYDDIKESILYSEKYDCIYLTLGYHPSEALKIGNDELLFLENLLCTCKKVVGLGEIGLDYHYGKDDIEEQKKLFEYQLNLAQKLNLPVVIHSRDAIEDTINILKKYKVKGVIHCFNCSLEIANIYIKMGFYLGIGGVLTFKNCKLPSVVKEIGLKNVVLETDSPYLAPEPYRGSINSSKNIPIIAKKISDILNISIEDVDYITTLNATRLFDLK